MSNDRKISPVFWVSLALALLTAALYWPVRNHAFIKFDDPDYVYENPRVTNGVTMASCARVLLESHSSNWHPLTWVSHMADWQMFGNWAGGHHLVNVLFHTLNTLLLLLVLRKLTGSLWRSAFVAALFAWHPLHVESVAWVSERKDVLSAFFWLLAIWAYARYVETGDWRRYLLTLGFFALGLMSKPMVVTLPCVLLLLDWWPLRRWQGKGPPTGEPGSSGSPRAETPGSLLLEKVPFFVLSLLSALVTFWAQKSGGSVVNTAEIAVSSRLANAVNAYAAYLRKMVWPDDLAAFYPLPTRWLPSEVVLAVMVLLAVSFLALKWARRLPFLAVGWLWYLGTLVPVIGLVQVGDQAMADRYTYLPLIGVFIMLAWGGGEAIRWRPGWKKPVFAAGGLALAACLALTSMQVRLWKDTGTLFRHTAAVTHNNWVALNFVAQALMDEGRTSEAIPYYHKALEAEPYDFPTLFNLGNALVKLNKFPAALDTFLKAARVRPEDALTQNWIGALLVQAGNFAAAETHLREAVRLAPADLDMNHNLGVALFRQRKFGEALPHFRSVLAANSQHIEANVHYAICLARQNRVREALPYFKTALRIDPGHPGALTELGLASSARGDHAAAVDYFSQLVRHHPNDSQARYQLAVAQLARRDAAAAIPELRAALALRTNWAAALNLLAWVLATHEDDKLRDGAEALALATRAVNAAGQPPPPRVLGTLAAAQAETGRFNEAAATAQTALDLARQTGQTNQIPDFEQRLKLYQESKPFRDPTLSPEK